jgi:outer membrane protein assembly factor BamB
VAYNAATGQPAWKIERPTDAPAESHDSYTTPAVLKTSGQTQIVISGGDYVTGHDPNSGAELWRVDGLNPRKDRNYRIIASPVVVGDMIYAPTRKTPLLAIAVEGPKEMTTRWQWTKSGGTDVPTPVSDGKYFYMVAEDGLISCADARTGEPVWGPQRSGAGTVWASPLLADGKLYIVNENGATLVLAAGPEFKVLATNELDGSYTLSSPVAVGNQLFIRTGTHLYCIGNAAIP